MRARTPDRDGYVVRNGVRLHYEIHGTGDRTLLFLPTWSIVHSHVWKAQVPYFARYFRVVTFDGRGNGRSDRPLTAADYADVEFAKDTLAVMDATETARATLVSLSAGARWSLLVATRYPERVEAAIFISPSVPIGPSSPVRAAAAARFEEPQPSYKGWRKFNRHYWLENYRDFLEFFFTRSFSEPHSTKHIEDAVGWGLETTPEILTLTVQAPGLSEEEAARLAASVRCPVLVIHGDEDGISPLARGAALAEATGGLLLTLRGSGHIPQARDPVRVNLAMREFIEPSKTSTWERGRKRRKRALFISSPIGLGHAQRDVAIASELRKHHPDIDIQWLAQHPVTEVLRAYNETIHPASAQLANETRHIEGECAEHDLHVFQTIRRMDEILIANFMVFYDLVRDEHFDLVVGDEAWDVDHFLHENPEEKRTAFAWMTDFVGWIPMPDGGENEARITADYNAEMIEHVERFPRLRDRAIFVGDPDDIVADRFGEGLPAIREWTESHYDFAGYVTGFTPPTALEREAWRAEFGYRSDEAICIVTVGGSGVGAPLLRRIINAYPEAKNRVPQLRMIVVAGPRIDPASLPSQDGLEIRSFVPNLYRHLAVCEVALVQGGLTTTMELTASRRPFIYFPLRHHFEQNFHVRHRLDRYGAGRCMHYDEATPEMIADAIATELAREIVYLPVTSAGALTAAKLIAELV